jgi:hypothetical protein
MSGIICSMVGATFTVAATATAFTNDGNTLLLLHMNGTDASTTFVDDTGGVAVSSAVSFDGSNDYYIASSITPSSTTNKYLLIACTFYWDSSGGNLQHLVNMRYGTTDDQAGLSWRMWINGGRIQNTFMGAGGSYYADIYENAENSLTSGAWNQIVYYSDFTSGSTANNRIFVNGVSKAITTQGWNSGFGVGWGKTNSKIKIGEREDTLGGDGSDNDFKGRVAQVYIHNGSGVPTISNFWDAASGKPKDLGVTGTATGLAQPLIYHYGDTNTFATNKGTGFNSYTLTATGNIAKVTGPTYSPANKTVTTVGNALVTTAQSKFGGASAYFDGAGDALVINDAGGFSFGTGDFTIEFWMRKASYTSADFFLIEGASDLAPNIYWYYGASYGLYLYHAGAARITTDVGSFSANTWHHIALVRSSGVTKFYVDGTQRGSSYTDTTDYCFPNGVRIGDENGGNGRDFNGWMDEIRFSNIARYTANFTAPSAAFVSDANTLLLIHCDGSNNSTTFTDVSSRTAKAITANGNAQIDTATSKFGGAAALFDGNGDYLTLGTQSDLNFGTSDFTIEAWVYFDQLSTTNRHTLISNGVASFTTNWIKFAAADLGSDYYPQVTAYNYSSGGAPLMTSSTAVSNGQWYHIAYVRYNTNHYLYLNGTQVASNTSGTAQGISVNWNANNITNIGRYSFDNGSNPSSTYFDGWIDELRISNKARYTGNFTPGV